MFEIGVRVLDYGMPRGKVRKIAKRLDDASILVPGYIPPKDGIFAIDPFLISHFEHGIDFYVVTDRNFITRMAKVPRDGAPAFDQRNKPTKDAIDLMAFAQAVNLNIDPSISFYEYAATEGCDAAWEELSRFRAADYPQADSWIDVAEGKSAHLSYRTPRELETWIDLVQPLTRYHISYTITLKVVEIARGGLAPMEQIKALLKWMIEDFSFSGPLAVFAALLFPSCTELQAVMFKKMHSPMLDRVVSSSRNVAWDMTYLGDFIAKVNSSDGGRMYLLATGDATLRRVAEANLAVHDKTEKPFDTLINIFEPYWNREQARELAWLFINASAIANARTTVPSGNRDPVDLSEEAEARFLAGQTI